MTELSQVSVTALKGVGEAMAEKLAKLKPGGPNPFVDPTGFQNEITIQETALNNELKRQEVEGPPPPRGGGRRGQN